MTTPPYSSDIGRIQARGFNEQRDSGSVSSGSSKTVTISPPKNKTAVIKQVDIEITTQSGNNLASDLPVEASINAFGRVRIGEATFNSSSTFGYYYQQWQGSNSGGTPSEKVFERKVLDNAFNADLKITIDNSGTAEAVDYQVVVQLETVETNKPGSLQAF